jgi:hypothetical protein
MFRLKTAAFFDAAAILTRLDPAKRAALSRGGAFIRRTAKTSIRRRKTPSTPGQPPTNQTGTLKKLLLFGWDPTTASVVIGPALFEGRRSPNTPKPPPLTLEIGGTIYRRRRDGLEPTRLAPRPYMAPALAKNLDRLPNHWNNVLK